MIETDVLVNDYIFVDPKTIAMEKKFLETSLVVQTRVDTRFCEFKQLYPFKKKKF